MSMDEAGEVIGYGQQIVASPQAASLILILALFAVSAALLLVGYGLWRTMNARVADMQAMIRIVERNTAATQAVGESIKSLTAGIDRQTNLANDLIKRS